MSIITAKREIDILPGKEEQKKEQDKHTSKHCSLVLDLSSFFHMFNFFNHLDNCFNFPLPSFIEAAVIMEIKLLIAITRE